MILKLDCKRTCANVQIAEKVQLKSIEVEKAVRSANLWVSIKRLQVEPVTSLDQKARCAAKMDQSIKSGIFDSHPQIVDC